MRIDSGRERAGSGRQGLVWQLLAGALSSVQVAGRVPVVLDCGGGSGSFAVPLAAVGARVTVVDISADALATLRRRADEAAVGDRVRAVQGDVEALADLVAAESFDLVLAHGILEAVDSAAPAFTAISGAVRPGGLLSVLVGNPVASVLARALAGEVAVALAELRALPADADANPGVDPSAEPSADSGPDPNAEVGSDADAGPLGPARVQALCQRAGLVVERVHGIGVFAELVPGAALDAPGAQDALRDLEAEAAARAPFTDIATRVHVLARRPER